MSVVFLPKKVRKIINLMFKTAKYFHSEVRDKTSYVPVSVSISYESYRSERKSSFSPHQMLFSPQSICLVVVVVVSSGVSGRVESHWEEVPAEAGEGGSLRPTERKKVAS